MTTPAASLLAKTKDRSALCGVVGLGYVGLPLVIEFVRAGYKVIGFDVSQKVVDLLNDGRSHIKDVPASVVAEAVRSGKFVATTDLTRLREPDAISICVPTPLNKEKSPDVSHILAASAEVRQRLRQKLRRPQAPCVLESHRGAVPLPGQPTPNRAPPTRSRSCCRSSLGW